jgi:hypothetical protein
MYGVPEDLPMQRFVGDTLTQVRIGIDGVHFVFGYAGTICTFGLWQIQDVDSNLIDQAQEHLNRTCYRIHVILNANVIGYSIDSPRSFSLTFSTGHQLTIYDDTPHYESCTIYFESGLEVII